MSLKTILIGLSIFRFGGEKSFHGRPSLELAPYDCSSQNTVSEDFAAWCKLVSKELRFNYLIARESAEWFDLINNNNLHLYSANLYMNIFGCALQYCYIKVMLKVTKA